MVGSADEKDSAGLGAHSITGRYLVAFLMFSLPILRTLEIIHLPISYLTNDPSIKDMFIIATSSCARFLPYGKGYNQLPSHSDSRNGSSRGSRAEDENRLIDQLDEEWDD